MRDSSDINSSREIIDGIPSSVKGKAQKYNIDNQVLEVCFLISKEGFFTGIVTVTNYRQKDNNLAISTKRNLFNCTQRETT